MTRFGRVFPRSKVLIGVIHLPPLPGYPASPGVGEVIEKALRDLEALEAGPVDGVLVETRRTALIESKPRERPSPP
jgi:predicted TIM-barrel enzyme